MQNNKLEKEVPEGIVVASIAYLQKAFTNWQEEGIVITDGIVKSKKSSYQIL